MDAANATGLALPGAKWATRRAKRPAGGELASWRAGLPANSFLESQWKNLKPDSGSPAPNSNNNNNDRLTVGRRS